MTRVVNANINCFCFATDGENKLERLSTSESKAANDLYKTNKHSSLITSKSVTKEKILMTLAVNVRKLFLLCH
jgi:hypothetical protein